LPLKKTRRAKRAKIIILSLEIILIVGLMVTGWPRVQSDRTKVFGSSFFFASHLSF
jgi:hypothetical protein